MHRLRHLSRLVVPAKAATPLNPQSVCIQWANKSTKLLLARSITRPVPIYATRLLTHTYTPKSGWALAPTTGSMQSVIKPLHSHAYTFLNKLCPPVFNFFPLHSTPLALLHKMYAFTYTLNYKYPHSVPKLRKFGNNFICTVHNKFTNEVIARGYGSNLETARNSAIHS